MNDPHAEARAAIRPVKEHIEDELLARAGVVAVDIAEKETAGEKTGELSIVVFVTEKVPTDDVPEQDRVPATIDGIRTDVQVMEVELQRAGVARMPAQDVAPYLDGSAYPTLTGGISMGPLRSVTLSPPDSPSPGAFVFVGTLGAMVRDRATGATMALTNFHVACVNTTWGVGDRMVQQSLVDGGTPAGQFGSLARAVLSEAVDGAVVRVDAGRAWGASVREIGDVAGEGAATVGMAVQKRGRTTEHTFGTVTSTDFTVQVPYLSDVGTRTFRRQIRIVPDTARNARFSQRGDSGSVIVDGGRHVVGLLFAGATDGSATFANPIRSVLDELGADILTPPPPVVLVTRPLSVCLTTRLTLCQVTRPGRCYVTRPQLCVVPTRAGVCDLVTRVCTTRVVCGPLLTRGGCEVDGPPVIGGFGAADGFDGSGYGRAADVDETYWAGYLAALEEVVALDEEAGD